MNANLIGVVGGIVAILATLGAGVTYIVNLSVNYGQLQQSVQSMTVSVDQLTHQLEDTSRNLDGLERFLMDLLASRNVVTPLDPDRYGVSDHDHEAPE